MRKFGVLSVAMILIIGVLGVAAVYLDQIVLAAIFGLLALVVLALVVLSCTRYIARLLRTSERKSRMARINLSRDVANIKLSQDSEFSHQFELIKATQKLIKAHENDVNHIGDEVSKLDARVQKTARSTASHVTQSARHATSEVEALLQIYSRYPDTKLPMPSTGGWALDAQSLAYLISLFEEQRPQRVLELGSGTSTIWLGYLCRLYGCQMVTLDHLEEYLDNTRAAIRRHGLTEYIESRFAPLEKYSFGDKTMKWYSRKALEGLYDIEMVLVDGPPAATGPKARFPALPMVADLLTPNATVVLDDAHRPDEEQVIEQWLSEYPEFSRKTIDTPRLAILSRSA